ncbi:uncharacterized protein LOC126893453 [Diabrotica virgifera virgifera]|uniref:Gustatory receptor n=1 Tax=Diabrotica virgifera virgifera TaxID=50390 RepID=A0ABM5LB00_DIAVI|nr:uncharacterized protein LOC126893453 [Diabrotica virgifera virgifera]
MLNTLLVTAAKKGTTDNLVLVYKTNSFPTYDITKFHNYLNNVVSDVADLFGTIILLHTMYVIGSIVYNTSILIYYVIVVTFSGGDTVFYLTASVLNITLDLGILSVYFLYLISYFFVQVFISGKYYSKVFYFHYLVNTESISILHLIGYLLITIVYCTSTLPLPLFQITTFSIAAASHYLCKESKNTVQICYDIINNSDLNKIINHNLLDQLTFLVQQVVYSSTSLSAAGFFDVNFSMMGFIVSSITSYIIVALQFLNDNSTP